VPGSQWRVVAVDGQRTEPTELLLTFVGESATLSTQCGASVGEVIVEDDGPGVRFEAFDNPAGATCPDDVMRLHERVAAALETVERWEPAGSGAELRGESVIRLEPQRTDT